MSHLVFKKWKNHDGGLFAIQNPFQAEFKPRRDSNCRILLRLSEWIKTIITLKVLKEIKAFFFGPANLKATGTLVTGNLKWRLGSYAIQLEKQFQARTKIVLALARVESYFTVPLSLCRLSYGLTENLLKNSRYLPLELSAMAGETMCSVWELQSTQTFSRHSSSIWWWKLLRISWVHTEFGVVY